MSNVPQDHQQLSPTSPSPTPSTQKPHEPWQAQEHEAPENQYLYGNGPYDGMEVAPTNDKEHATSAAYTSGSHEATPIDNKRRRVCGMPIMAFFALLGFLAVAVILGAVLGGVLGSRATKNRELEETAMTTTPTAEHEQSTVSPTQSRSTAGPESTETGYSGPLRSDEWHYIFWPKNGTNLTLAVNYDPYNITSFQKANNSFSTIFDNLHNGTRPMFGDMSNTTQHWQFLEIPKSLKATEGIRRSLDANMTLYWIANRALGQNLRLTTDLSTSQDPKLLQTFRSPPFSFHAVGMRVATDLNPAQWWYVGDKLNGEDSPGDGWWIANAYTRTAVPGGLFKDYYFGERCGNDTTESFGTATSRYIGREGCMGDTLIVTPWNIQVVEKITEDGWRVS